MKGTPDIMKGLQEGSLTDDECIKLIQKRVRKILKLSKDYTLPHLGGLECLKLEYGKISPVQKLGRIEGDSPVFKGGEFWYYGAKGYSAPKARTDTSGIFFWSPKCDVYWESTTQEGVSPDLAPWLNIEGMTGLKRFAGLRCDIHVHWVHGCVVIGKKKQGNGYAERALLVGLYDSKHRQCGEDGVGSVDDLRSAMKYVNMTPTETFIMLSKIVERWEKRAERRYSTVKRALECMRAENKLARQ